MALKITNANALKAKTKSRLETLDFSDVHWTEPSAAYFDGSKAASLILEAKRLMNEIAQEYEKIAKGYKDILNTCGTQKKNGYKMTATTNAAKQIEKIRKNAVSRANLSKTRAQQLSDAVEQLQISTMKIGSKDDAETEKIAAEDTASGTEE